MIGIVDVEVQAKFPSMPLDPMQAFVNSPSSIRLRNVPRKIGNWQITSVNFQITYPDAEIKSADCVLVGGVWVGTVAGTSTPGTSDFGYAIYASGIDEHGNTVTGYCLGKGDVEILDDQGEVTPSEHATYTKLLSAEPADPQNGNIWQVSGTYYIQQFGQTWPIGDDSGLIGELSTKLDDKADISAVPTKTSQLSNDSWFIQQNGMAVIHDLTCDYLVANQAYIVGYATESDLSSKADLSAVPTKTSDLTNDSGFITASEVPTPSYIEDADGNKIEADRTFTWREKCSWYVSEMNGGTYTYDPPLECAWGTYTIDDGLSQTQKQMWMSKTPYAHNEYFGIGANLGYVEYYDKVGETFVVETGDMIEEHTDNSITKIGLESCSITRTGEWSDRTATLATEEWVSGRDFIQDSAGNKIEADLDYFVRNTTLPWTLTDGADTYTLNYVEQSGTWLYEEAETKKIELAYSAENSLWELSFYVWNNSEWQFDAGNTTIQEEDVTSLSILEWTLTRSILVNDKLALVSDLPTVNDATITLTQGGTTKGTFSLNQVSAQTIAFDAPPTNTITLSGTYTDQTTFSYSVYTT